jgi:hypothetical protein
MLGLHMFRKDFELENVATASRSALLSYDLLPCFFSFIDWTTFVTDAQKVQRAMIIVAQPMLLRPNSSERFVSLGIPCDCA